MKVARIVTARNAVFAREERQSLHNATGAVAVDMESHAIGVEATRRSVPFTSLRVISDDLDSTPLPDWRGAKELWSNPREIREKSWGNDAMVVIYEDFQTSGRPA